MTTPTYGRKADAERAARRKLGDDAVFITEQNSEGRWTYHPRAKPARKRGSGAFIRDQILKRVASHGVEGLTTEWRQKLAERTRKRFGGRTGPSDIAWNLGRLRKAGKVPPARVGAWGSVAR